MEEKKDSVIYTPAVFTDLRMGDLIVLNNGRKMPQIQLGTYRTRGADVAVAVTSALEAGYRAVDTAAVYRSHEQIADTLETALPALGLTREDIFITSKLAPRDHGTKLCRTVFQIPKILLEHLRYF